MTKKRDTERGQKLAQDGKALSRRDVFKTGMAAGVVGAAGLAGAAPALAQQDFKWDYEADVVVVGGGGVGLVAAIRARDLGASVILLEQNHDIGGKIAHSGGWTSLGGGDAIQERDRAGADPMGMGLTAPLVPPQDLEDDPELLFTDMTDWSVIEQQGVPHYRYNDRELHRAWADNTVAVRQFLMDNYVRFSRITGTHEGGGMSRARAPWAIMKLADKTDIKAGTVSLQDKADGGQERSSPFNSNYAPPGPSAAAYGAPGWVSGGFVIGRSLEFSAREKGVRVMVHRHMDELIREQPSSGRVLGVRASYTPRFSPKTGERLESFWKNGNIEEKAETITVRARKAVIIGTGGYMGNKNFRTMFDPRLTDDTLQYGDALMGPLHEDASGILAGMKVGAALAGLFQGYQSRLGSPFLDPRIGTRNTEEALFPGHPAFEFIKATGVQIGGSGWEQVIAVNQVGKRFYNESAIPVSTTARAAYPATAAGARTPWVPLDWRNCSVEQVRKGYTRASAADAALAINEGSRGPNYSAGPVWAIFDSAAVRRGGWELRYPYIADPPDGFFHKADTLKELARKVVENPNQKMPLKHLEQTVARFNSFVDKGKDEDFEKPVMHKIDAAPFYAAIIPLAVNDSYGGLRINGKTQVIDLNGQVIPGLYAGGEASGGGKQHGIGRATVHGFIAGTHAVKEPVA